MTDRVKAIIPIVIKFLGVKYVALINPYSPNALAIAKQNVNTTDNLARKLFKIETIFSM